MLLYTSRKYFITLWYSKFMVWTKMNHVQTGILFVHVMYIPCTNKYIYYWIRYFSTYHVLTCTYNNIHLCSCIYVYILVKIMYIAHSCLALTISHFFEHENQNIKLCLGWGSNPWSCAYHVLTTVLLAMMQWELELNYMYNVLPGGWWRTSGAGPAASLAPAMTLPARALTWISLKQRSESAANLKQECLKQAEHPCPIEKQPATWKQVGCCSIDTD